MLGVTADAPGIKTAWSPTRAIELMDANGIAANPSAVAAIMSLAPGGNLLFETDYPDIPIEKTVRGLEGTGLPAEALAAINRENARRLLPCFARAQ